MGHIFLRKLQRLAQSRQLKGVAEQDWKVLLKNYGISKLDFNNMSDADLRAWTDTHEKFATDFERYMMTGEAPSSKMKHIFEQFKRWLTNIYHSIGSRNIEAKRTSYILAKPLLYDGQRFIMLMVVNEDTQGKKYYNHEFTTIKKIDGLPTVLRKSKTTEGGQNHQSLDKFGN